MNIRGNDKSTWGILVGKDASAIMLDPHKRLIASMSIQARKDLCGNNIILALDALLWWLSDAPFWLRCLGFEDDPDKVFQAIM